MANARGGEGFLLNDAIFHMLYKLCVTSYMPNSSIPCCLINLTNTQLNIKSLSTLKIPKNIFIDLNI